MQNMDSFQKIKSKIKSLDEIVALRKQWGNNGKKVVFTNGCFDLIHLGHLDYLTKASDLGDKFIIAVNSDSSVELLKGKGRPIKDEFTRMMLLASLEFVDIILLFNEETPYEILSKIIPDILIKGGDYNENDIVGADIIKKNGGKVIILPFLEGYSTSKFEQKIIKNNCKEIL